LDITQVIGDNRATGTTLFNLAVCHGLQGNLEGAISLGEAALKILDNIHGATESVVKENLDKWKNEFQQS
jgi:hypothetical protein